MKEHAKSLLVILAIIGYVVFNYVTDEPVTYTREMYGQCLAFEGRDCEAFNPDTP